MTTFKVFQPINREGRSSEAARSLMLMFRDDGGVGYRVITAAMAGAYVHAADAEAEDQNGVFHITNACEWDDTCEAALTRHGRMRSGSVGDVYLNTETNEAFVVLGMGWTKLTETERKQFEVLVPQKMGLVA